MEGLDAVQIAVANRDCLCSPPVACHSIHKQITSARDLSAAIKEQQAEPDLYLKVFSLCLFSFSIHCFFFLFFFKLPSIAFCSLLLPFTTPTLLFNSLLLQPQQGQTTDSLLCVNLTEKQCVCVCACLYWEHFFLNLQHSFGSGGQAFSECERGDPRGAVIWLNKQPDSERYLLQRAPGTAEINLRLWTSEGSIHLRQQPL